MPLLGRHAEPLRRHLDIPGQALAALEQSAQMVAGIGIVFFRLAEPCRSLFRPGADFGIRRLIRPLAQRRHRLFGIQQHRRRQFRPHRRPPPAAGLAQQVVAPLGRRGGSGQDALLPDPILVLAEQRARAIRVLGVGAAALDMAGINDVAVPLGAGVNAEADALADAYAPALDAALGVGAAD